MKKLVLFFLTATLFGWVGITRCNACNSGPQVYDLKADWSDTQNPNGTWSYRQRDALLVSNPFPWVGAGYSCFSFPPVTTAMEKITGEGKACAGTFVYPGVLEDGDIFVVPGNGGKIVWTAPDSGTIDISGSAWEADLIYLCYGVANASWTLTDNGFLLSGGGIWSSLCNTDNPRGTPDDFSLGSGGTAALRNVTVAAGDQIILAFSGYPVGVNFRIAFTAGSADPITAIEGLAITVLQMNLQNGIANGLDAKLDAALSVLTDVNLNNDSAACNSLSAFTSAVEAQRGKKITGAQADQLIASAHEIQGCLRCTN